MNYDEYLLQGSYEHNNKKTYKKENKIWLFYIDKELQFSSEDKEEVFDAYKHKDNYSLPGVDRFGYILDNNFDFNNEEANYKNFIVLKQRFIKEDKY